MFCSANKTITISTNIIHRKRYGLNILVVLRKRLSVLIRFSPFFIGYG